MNDDRDVLERLAPLFPSPDGGLESCLRLRDRRRRNRQVGAIALAAIVTGALVGSLVFSVDRSKQRPADRGPITPSNVSDLQVAWTAETAGDPRPLGGSIEALSESDRNLYVVAGAHADISSFSVDCGTDGATCEPTWNARLRVPPNACGPIRCVGAMTSGPAVSAGHVFVGSLHHLTAFPVDCVGPCRPVWNGVIHDPDGIVHQAVVADGVVYAGTGGGHLYAFPVECEGRCQPLWVSQRQRTSLRVLQVADGVVYADTEEFWGSATPDPTSYPMAYAFSVDCSRRCRPLWTTRLARGPEGVSLTAHAGTVYVAGSTGRGEGTLSAYTATCGIRDSCRSWTTSLSGNAADLLIVDDTLVVTVPNADQVRAYPLVCSDGCGPLWSATVPGIGGRPVGANGLVYVPSAAGVAAIPLGCGTGGASCRPIQVTSHPAAGMAVGDGRLFVRSSNGQVYAFTLPAPIDARSADRGLDVGVALALVVAVSIVGSIAFIRSRRRVS